MGFPMKQVHVAGQPALNAEPIYSYGQWLQRCDDRRGSLMGLKKININSHSGLYPAVLGQGCWALKHIAYCSAQMLIKSKWSWRLQATSFFNQNSLYKWKKQTNQPTNHKTSYQIHKNCLTAMHKEMKSSNLSWFKAKIPLTSMTEIYLKVTFWHFHFSFSIITRLED